MATKEQIGFIRNARAGKTAAQLILGKYYLFGGAGLQKNVATGLYWLHRAALRDADEAWQLIGEHVPFEVASRAPDPMRLATWYERAYDAGAVKAGLVWVKLLLMGTDSLVTHPSRAKAMVALEQAAAAGHVEAQWLLAQQLKRAGNAVAVPATSSNVSNALAWATRAAANGVLQAQRALADRAWTMNDIPAFLRWSAPVAQAILQEAAGASGDTTVDGADASLLARRADALYRNGDGDAAELEQCWTLAAAIGDKHAQFALGLWHANMDDNGERLRAPTRNSNYRKAIHWLSEAGRQGVAGAWHALFRIYTRPNTGLADRTGSEIEAYLERAAEYGHLGAQLELGKRCWRSRRHLPEGDVRAAYWLQRAASQGSDEALSLLQLVATAATPSPWAADAQQQLTREMRSTNPFLAARIDLAACFGLSLPEALLLDINSADRGHCLTVDISAMHARSKRRLILIASGEERLALSRIARHFAHIDCGADGPEGNYRQRLYLFNKLFPASAEQRKAMLKSAVRPVGPVQSV